MKKGRKCIFSSLARHLYDNVIHLFRAVLSQNWRLTCMFATIVTLLLVELSCSHILNEGFLVRLIVLYKDHLCMVCAFFLRCEQRQCPIYKQLESDIPTCTLLFLQHFKTCSQEGSLGLYLHLGSTGTSTSMHICHDIITSILSSTCSKTFWLVSWLYYCFMALRPILGHFECGKLASLSTLPEQAS